MEEIKVVNLLDLNNTIAKEIFKDCDYPWKVLPKISDFIMELGEKLDKKR